MWGEEFLRVFPFALLAGDASQALKGPSSSVVITESTARRLFGTADALNRTVRFGSDFLKMATVVPD